MSVWARRRRLNIVTALAMLSAVFEIGCDRFEQRPSETNIASSSARVATSALPHEAQAESQAQSEHGEDKAKLADSEWFYRMRGNLDAANLSCTARSHVSEVASGENRCIDWELIGLKCKGSRDADWVHEDGNNGKICKTQQAWELKNDLPGQAFCAPTVTEAKDGHAASVRLECTWQCRTGANPCAGTATYEFSRIAFATGVKKNGAASTVVSHP